MKKTSKDDKDKKKKRQSEFELFIMSVMEKSMKQALNIAIDDILKDWK